MKKKAIITIILIILLSVIISVVFLFSLRGASESIILDINYEDVESVEIVTNGLFGSRDDTIRKSITETTQIERYIDKLKKIKLYRTADEQFGTRDFTTTISINMQDGGAIDIYMVSIQARISETDSPENIIRSSELYYISPLSWLSVVGAV